MAARADDHEPGLIESVSKFLKSYPVFQTKTEDPPTIFEIARFPHWENVYSNVLAFFLDRQQLHGFDDLFVRSTLVAYEKRRPCNWGEVRVNTERPRAVDRVERELDTDERKRIDIVVECSDLVICIENKIWSGLHNDLRHYRVYCERHNDRPVIGVVLSPVALSSDDDQKKLKDSRFVNITYLDLVEQVETYVGKYIDSQNIRYQHLLLDFLEQARKLTRIDIMTEEQQKFLQLWRENELEINNIQHMSDNLSNLLKPKEKADAHGSAVMELLPAEVKGVFSEPWIYNRNTTVIDLAKDVESIGGCIPFLDIRFHPLRISYYLGKRKGSVQPIELGDRVKAKSPSIGFEWDEDLKRHVFTIDGSPFDDCVQKRAVEITVEILSILAEIRFETDRNSGH